MNVIPIGTLGGAASRAEAIRASTGAVVGGAEDAQGDLHAFLFENNTLKDLTPFPIPLPFPTMGSPSAAASARGIGLSHAQAFTVVATVSFVVPAAVMVGMKANFSRGFLIDTSLQRVDDVGLLGVASGAGIGVTADLRANAINDFGQVIGAVEIAPATFRAFIFDMGTGQMQILGTLAPNPRNPAQLLGESEGFGINDRGFVVGMAHAIAPGGGGLVPHAFLFDPNTGQMRDLGTLPPPSAVGSTARGINNRGQVVGVSSAFDANTASVERAFLFDRAAGLRDLGTLIPANRSGFPQDRGSSEAFAIDALGRVVGSADSPQLGPNGTPVRHGFLFDSSALVPVLQDLNDPPLPGGWIIHEATGIDAVGQICGVGSNPSQNIASQAILLVP